jgi:hypothetical protein
LFFFLEVAVIPKFLLIGIWGSGKKGIQCYEARPVLMAGSALVFVGLVVFISTQHNIRYCADSTALHPAFGSEIIFPLGIYRIWHFHPRCFLFIPGYRMDTRLPHSCSMFLEASL